MNKSKTVSQALRNLLLALSFLCLVPAYGQSAAAGSSAATPAPPAAGDAGAATDSDAEAEATAVALANLGLALLRAPGLAAGPGKTNAAHSPLSLLSALALVHAGTDADSARELSQLIGPAPAGEKLFLESYPAVLRQMGGDSLLMANRVWVGQDVAPQLNEAYLRDVKRRYASDAELIDFEASPLARSTINAWVADNTGGRVTDLLKATALTSGTKLVLTNAVDFKADWEQAFLLTSTKPAPFFTAAALPKNLPTLHQTAVLRHGLLDGALVAELLFEGRQFSLLLALPPEGQTLQDFDRTVTGPALVQWRKKIKSGLCALQLPRFSIQPKTASLKAMLQALGVRRVFTSAANFSPMLGNEGHPVTLDNVYQAAGMRIDEHGAQAVAATAAVTTSKALAPVSTAQCAFNRPFLWALVHRASGAPVFMGRVVDPGAD
ncbi:MAG: serpin family protein [Burkholderiaceae bacterium]